MGTIASSTTPNMTLSPREVKIIYNLSVLRTQKIDSAYYDRDKNKLIEELCEYAMYYDKYIKSEFRKLNKQGEFGFEIFEVARNCIRYYSGNPNEFLNYFNASLNKKFKKAKGKMEYDAIHVGVTSAVKTTDHEILNKYKPISIDNNQCTNDNDQVVESTPELSIDKGTLKSFYDILQDKKLSINDVNEYWHGVIQFSYASDSTDERLDAIDYLDTIPGECAELNDIHDSFALMDTIDEVYSTLQERKKAKFAMLFTATILETTIDSEPLFDYLHNKHFFDNQVFTFFQNYGFAPEMRWIADKLSITPQGISRDYNVFKKKIEKAIK